MLTAVGAGARRSVEVVQAIVAPWRVLPPVPAAAVTMLGDLPAFFDNGNSNAQTNTGNNCGVSGGAYAPVVGTTSPASRAQVQHDINRPQNFSAGPFTGTGTVGDLTDLSDPVVAAAGHGMLDLVWTECEELKALVVSLRQNADYYCNEDIATCTFPVTGPSSIVFIDGDMTSTPSGSFSGILIVTGQLTYNGNTGWDGIVMVIGEGRLIRSGGGSASPSGGVIVGAIDPSPTGPSADRSDWCTSGMDGFLQSVYDTSGGGNSSVEWCSTTIDAANPALRYRVVDFLER
jgi:hypothetical protein